MASATTRRILDTRRRKDRDRKRAKRAELRARGVPPKSVIEAVLVAALRDLVTLRYGHPRDVPADSDIHSVVHSAAGLLALRGYDIQSPQVRVLFGRAIGG